MRLRVVSLLLVGAISPALGLGASQCSWGPSYWCANIQQVSQGADVRFLLFVVIDIQASQCGAVRHCINQLSTGYSFALLRRTTNNIIRPKRNLPATVPHFQVLFRTHVKNCNFPSDSFFKLLLDVPFIPITFCSCSWHSVCWDFYGGKPLFKRGCECF